MKNFLFTILFTLALLIGSTPTKAQTSAQEPIDANFSMILAWNPNPEVELVIKYNVYASEVLPAGSTNAPFQKMVSTTINGIEVVELLRNTPNGIYKFEITAVNS